LAASGRAYWSPSRGLVFNAEQLPALTPGRVYQLWVLTPADATISAGVFTVAADGSASATFTLPPGASVPKVVAVTNEPAPAGSAGPTTPILLVGQAAQ
jgi:anti-sigma-K factor RskA